MPGVRDTWKKPLPRQNIVRIRRAERTALTRRQRADLAELNADELTDVNERNLWTTEYKLARGIGQDSSAAKAQGGRKTRRRKSLQRKTRKNRR